MGWIFLGLVAGLWLDLVLRKLDGSRADSSKMLGTEMARYGNYLGQHGSMPDSAKIKSYFHSARESGLWAPDAVNINREVDYRIPDERRHDAAGRPFPESKASCQGKQSRFLCFH